MLQNSHRVRLTRGDSVLGAFAASMAAGVSVFASGCLREAAERAPSAERERKAQQDGNETPHRIL
jgi:hypothetical protein